VVAGLRPGVGDAHVRPLSRDEIGRVKSLGAWRTQRRCDRSFWTAPATGAYHDVMTQSPQHLRCRNIRVSEPMRIFSSDVDLARPDRLTQKLDATQSDELRRGLSALDSRPASTRARSSARLPLPNHRALRDKAVLDESRAVARST